MVATSFSVPLVLEQPCVRDDELVVAAINGEEEAYAALFTRHKQMVAAIGGRFFARREQIEEIIQTSFHQAFLGLRRYRGGQNYSFAAWLKRIAVTTCLDELRKVQRRNENLVSELSPQEIVLLAAIKTDGTNAEQQNIARDLAQKLLVRLKPEDRVAMTLLYEAEYSVVEIAGLLGWSVSKVKNRTFKARNELLAWMKKSGIGEV